MRGGQWKEEPGRSAWEGRSELRTWTSLFADLSGKVLHISWEKVKAVPIGHHFNPMQKHICLVLKEMVFVFLEHYHVVLQVHLIWHGVQEERLEYLVTQRFSTAHEQE